MDEIVENKLQEIKKMIIRMTYKAQVSHVGAALSVVDILYSLYFDVTDINSDNIEDKNRDVIILSKGHASAALYSVLYYKGLISKNYIETYAINGGELPCHIDKNKSLFFEVSTGSLGHGPSVAVGMALAKKMDKLEGRVYVICGDGECNEGSVWEAIMFAGTHRLNNLTLIIDYNKLQAFGKTNEVIDQSNIKARFEDFNFDTLEIDGHNLTELSKALRYKSARPICIIANTIKGKGVSFMEDKLEWHYKSPNEEQMLISIKEIEDGEHQ